MREVLLVTKTGEVFSGVPESENIRHDMVAAEILKQEIDANYQAQPETKSMYDNCLNAAKFYQMLAIMDDVSDLIAFFPDVISSEQVVYFVENFAEELEEGVKRFHLAKYVAARDKIKDINSKDLLKLYAKIMEEKQNGLNR